MLRNSNKYYTKPNVNVVFGAPGSGKTTYVMENKSDKDLIVDMDRLYNALTGLENYNKPDELLPLVCTARDAIIDKLSKPAKLDTAWIIGCYPKSEQRLELRRKLKATFILMDTDKKTCFERIKKDERRKEDISQWESRIVNWFNRFTVGCIHKRVDNA